MTKRNFSSRSIRLGVRLLAASSLALSAVTLSSCADNTDTTSGVYQTQTECVADKMFTEDYCAQAFHKAAVESAKRSPQYATQQDCDSDWNSQDCQPVVQGGHYVYVPQSRGVWVGYSQKVTDKGTASSPRENFAYPVYRNSGGDLYSPATDQTVDGIGRMSHASAPDVESAHAYTSSARPVFSSGESISRGGFGGMGHGFGGGE